MNKDLINDFREKVNENMFLWCNKSNPDAINNWNIICACMDWIDVSVENLQSRKLSKGSGLQSCMDCYTFICCIDIARDAMQKLHEAILNNKDFPWKNDNTIFQNNIFGIENDDRYFSKLRACFGAHPVDINIGTRKEPVNMYASWSMPGNLIGNKSDYCVKLYSGKDGVDDINVEFNMSDLLKYFKIRYDHLTELVSQIDSLSKKFVEGFRESYILEDSNPIKQIEILREENNLRYDSETVDGLLVKMASFLNTSFSDKNNEEVINEFKNKILLGIDEVKRHLQNMDCEELQISKIFNPSYRPKNGFGYNYSKLYSSVFTHGDTIYITDELIAPLKKYISFDYKTTEELYWIVVIGLNLAQDDLAKEKNTNLQLNNSRGIPEVLKQLLDSID